MKNFVWIFWSLSALGILQGQDLLDDLTQYPPDSIKQEWHVLFTEYTQKHPGFYRYNEKAAFDKQIQETLEGIQDSLNELEVYRIMKPLIAQIGCLHTGISLSEKTENLLNKESNCIPLEVYHFQGRVYSVGNLGMMGMKKGIPLGSELLTINGRAVKEIYSQILRSIPMDGYNETGKRAILNQRFGVWYRNMVEVKQEFEVSYSFEGKTFSRNLKGVNASLFPRFETRMSDSLSWKFQDSYALLRIPSFAQSYHKTQKQNFRKEIRKGFQILREQRIPNLIVDLRGNTGGSDSHAAYFASFLFEEVFRYWDRIEVSPPIAKDIKGINRLFYGKPEQQDSVWLWKKSGFFTREFDFYEVQQPAKFFFSGNIYVLIDGLCMSSCSDVAAILHYNHKAIFIGEETGGGYQGNTSGLIPEEQLPIGIYFSFPLLKYVNAVDSDTFQGHGTIPDDPVLIPVEAYIKGEDLVLKKAIEYIGSIDPS
ncbi:MAG: S41 family peptidase [Bacteroidota bacterium]